MIRTDSAKAPRRLPTSLQRSLQGLLLVALAMLVGCGGAPKGPVVKVLNNQLSRDNPGDKPPPPLTEKSVSAWNLGSMGQMTADDLRPMMSEGEAYNEKWEFSAYGDPYEVKLKFTVANLGWGDFKGRVNGYIRRKEDGKRWKFDQKMDQGKWKVSKTGEFEMKMGNFEVKGVPGRFSIRGAFDDHAFALDLDGNAWRPGSGITVFGRELADYSKTNSIMTQGTIAGTVTVSGENVPITGHVYANHFATNVGIHEQVETMYRFRKHTDDMLIEFKQYETNDKFDRVPFGFLVISYKGVVVFESTSIEVTPLGWYEDPKHEGYSAAHGLVVSAKTEHGEVRLSFPPGEMTVKNPLAKLPALERTVAEQITRPMDFTNKTTWRLDIIAEGHAATIEEPGSYSVTIFH